MSESGAAERVLIVYPPGATARGMADALSGAGIEVETVDNVYRAVSSFTARPADLVVLGVAYLDERDLEVIRVLRELRSEVYVLLAFPGASRDRAVKALAFGADTYILEPFYLGEFLDLVRRGLLRTRRPAVRAGAEAGELEQMAGAVAHAINNPLQILELLLSEGTGPETDAEEFRQETRRIQAVVQELLAFVRRTELRREPVDLNALVREVVPASGGRRRRIRHELADDLPEIDGDPERLRTALGALSALGRAHGADGRLVVRTEVEEEDERGGRVRLFFRAPEVLLSPEDQRGLFRAFSGPLQGSVGLAAATARAVFELHGASVAVESRQGEGTDVTVLFPAREATRRS